MKISLTFFLLSMSSLSSVAARGAGLASKVAIRNANANKLTSSLLVDKKDPVDITEEAQSKFSFFKQYDG